MHNNNTAIKIAETVDTTIVEGRDCIIGIFSVRKTIIVVN
jgi:hypothetical protein